MSASANDNTTTTLACPGSEPSRGFHCDICGASFTLKHNMRRHKVKCAAENSISSAVNRDGAKVNPCPICAKHFYRSDKLQCHLMTAHKMRQGAI